MRPAAGALVGAILVLSCGGENPTEIVLVVDSDLDVPLELDAIDVTIAGRSGPPVMVAADLTDSSTPELPLTLTLYPSGAVGSPVALAIVGSLGDVDIVRRDVRTSFAVGETRMLRVLLAERCLTLDCNAVGTCDETGCRPIDVPSADLPEWPGQAPVLDGPACTPAPEACNSVDDDCDGMLDEGIDVLVDVANCGRCGRACPGGATCAGGYCAGEQAMAIAAGGSHMCAIRVDRTLACWGWNLYGQLGDGTTNDRTRPVEIAGISSVAEVSAGVVHTCAIGGEGQLFCWGSNDVGQLGDGTTENRLAPTPVMIGAVAHVSAGVRHTCALTNAGQVACWGGGGTGQIGNGATDDVPVPFVVPLALPAVSVSCGLRHTCAVLNDGTGACWGGNGFGQLGTTLGDPQLVPTPVMGATGLTSVVAGRLHTCALAGATPLCWGDGGRGQLGSGTSTPRAMPLPVLYTGVATGLSTGAAAEHACLWDASSVSCWGANSASQLGDGTVDTAFMPVTASSLGTATSVAVGGAGGGARGYTCAIDALGVVRCVGDNGLGQLGDGSRIDSLMPSEVALRRE